MIVLETDGRRRIVRIGNDPGGNLLRLRPFDGLVGADFVHRQICPTTHVMIAFFGQPSHVVVHRGRLKKFQRVGCQNQRLIVGHLNDKKVCTIFSEDVMTKVKFKKSTCLIHSTIPCCVSKSNSLILVMNNSLLGHCTAAPSSSKIKSFIFSTPSFDSGVLQTVMHSGTISRVCPSSSS